MITKFVFNTIYTPGSVQYLYWFVFSWLKWSDCSFRLVVNGCTPEEIRILRGLCAKDPRLELFILSSKKVINHGAALNFLQSLEQSEYFCFMDPDILITGEFLNGFRGYLRQYSGVFSGTAICCTSEEQVLPDTYPKMLGRHNRTKHGTCLGSTYFAIYNNHILTELIQSTGIGFTKFSWQEIPSQYQHQIAKMRLKKERYDTGKLLNLLLVTRGESLLFRNLPMLQHIGGMAHYRRRKIGKGLLHRLQEVLNQLPEKQAKPLREKLYSTQDLPTLGRLLTDAEWVIILPVIVSNNEVLISKFQSSRYIDRLFQAVFENQPLPAIPNMHTSESEKKIQEVTSNIVALYKEFTYHYKADN